MNIIVDMHMCNHIIIHTSMNYYNTVAICSYKCELNDMTYIPILIVIMLQRLPRDPKAAERMKRPHTVT